MSKHVNLNGPPEYSPPLEYSPEEEYRNIIQSYFFELQDAALFPSAFQQDFRGVIMQSPTTINYTQWNTQIIQNATPPAQQMRSTSGPGYPGGGSLPAAAYEDNMLLSHNPPNIQQAGPGLTQQATQDQAAAAAMNSQTYAPSAGGIPGSINHGPSVGPGAQPSGGNNPNNSYYRGPQNDPGMYVHDPAAQRQRPTHPGQGSQWPGMQIERLGATCQSCNRVYSNENRQGAHTMNVPPTRHQ